MIRTQERRREWWLRHLAEGTDLAPEFLNYLNSAQMTARSVMKTDVITATETTAVSDIEELMVSHDIKRIPIVRDGRLVGIVTRADLVKTMVRRPEALLNASG
jgi:CBS-domain-containing membrane protein